MLLLDIAQFVSSLATQHQLVVDVSVWRKGRACQSSCIALPSGGLLGVELGMIALPATSTEDEEREEDRGQSQEQGQGHKQQDGDVGSQVVWERMRVYHSLIY